MVLLLRVSIIEVVKVVVGYEGDVFIIFYDYCCWCWWHVVAEDVGVVLNIEENVVAGVLGGCSWLLWAVVKVDVVIICDEC